MKFSWMKMRFDDQAWARIERLSSVHCRGVETWLKTLFLVNERGGEMTMLVLLKMLVSHHLSRVQVEQILVASGDFEKSENGERIRFTDDACRAFFGVSPWSKITTVGCAHELANPEKENNKEKEEEEKKEKEKESGVSVQEASAQMVALLVDGPMHQLWRETILMQHPCLRTMLEADFAWCLEYFFAWSVSNGNDMALCNVREAKKYFSNFCRNAQTKARMAEAYLKRQQPQHEPSPEEQQFGQWMAQHFPQLSAMEHPLTLVHWQELKRRCPDEQRLIRILQQLENTRDLLIRDRYAYYSALRLLNLRRS